MNGHDQVSSMREEAFGDGDSSEQYEENKNFGLQTEHTGTIRPEYITRIGSRKRDTKILCRIDQPIQDLMVKPHITIPKKTNEQLRFSESDLKMTWYRYSIRTMCSSERCIFGEDFGNNLIPLTAKCVTCLKYGDEEHSRFCCVKCMIVNWKDHQSRYHRKEAQQEVRSELCVQSNTDNYLSRFMNTLNTPEKEGIWEIVCEGPAYKPTKRDIGHQLKIVLSVPNKDINIHSEYISAPVVAYPPFPLSRVILSKPTLNPNPFNVTICSYNILAEAYATSQLYGYCPKWALLWDYRKTRLFRDIESMDADIYCLQEVQQDAFNDFWVPKMAELNYKGHFVIKTRFSPTPNKVDGCALFYKTSKFQLFDEIHLQFNDLVNNDSSLTDEQKARMLKNNVAQILILGAKSDIPTPILCICNCHIFWNQEYKDVKLWQIYKLITYLECYIFKQADMHIFLCGDFNSEPSSAVYEFISQGKIDPSHPDLSYDPLSILSSIKQLSHTKALFSAYKSFFGEEPKYTNYTGHYQGCLDYIWYTRISSLVGVSPIPSEEHVRFHRDTYIPNPQYPSDHLPLIAKFDLNQN